MKALVAISLVIVLTGCVQTVSVKLGNDFVAEKPQDGRGLMYLYWPNDASLDRGTRAVEINIDKKIINLPNGSYTTLQLLPGKHPVVFNGDEGEVTIGEGEQLYFEVQYNRHYDLLLTVLTRSTFYSGSIAAEVFDTPRVYIEHCKKFDITSEDTSSIQEKAGSGDGVF